MARFDQIVALLLAGGHGCRIHSDRPKQFMEVAGIPVIAYTMRTLQEHPDVDAMYVVCAAEWEDFVRETARVAGVDKLRGTFPAGGTSLQSVKNGVEGLRGVYGGRNPVVLTHEAVRPLLSREMIDCNLRTFHAYGNAITAVRSNMAAFNHLQAEILDTVLTRISQVPTGDLSIPIGSLTGSALLAGRGPRISVRMESVGSSEANFRNAFTSAGINQTKHQIILTVDVSVSILLPGFRTATKVSNSFIVAETVIVGMVPDTYTYFSTDPDTYEEDLKDYILNNS